MCKGRIEHDDILKIFTLVGLFACTCSWIDHVCSVYEELYPFVWWLCVSPKPSTQQGIWILLPLTRTCKTEGLMGRFGIGSKCETIFTLVENHECCATVTQGIPATPTLKNLSHYKINHYYVMDNHLKSCSQ